MNRRDFLKAAAGGLFASIPGLALCQYDEDIPAPPAPKPLIPASYTHAKLASGKHDPVGVRLVCLLDISGSIDTAEYELQRLAVAEALESDDFRYAVFAHAGARSLAICVGLFGSLPYMPVPWLDVRKGEGWKLQALADEVRRLERPESGSTNQFAALEYSMPWFQNCPWKAGRNIIDIITDGTNDSGGADAQLIVDRLARELDVTVNALVIEDYPETRTLEKWAAENLVTKAQYFRKDGSFLDPGFVKVVAYEKSEESKKATVEYRDAVKLAFRNKLILEVARMEPDKLRRLAALEAANQNPVKKMFFGL